MSVGGTVVRRRRGVCDGGAGVKSVPDRLRAGDFEDFFFFRFFDGNVCVERNGGNFAMSKVGQQAGELSQQGETGIWTEVKKKGLALFQSRHPG